MKKQVLFVDDEPRVLDGLRRMLRALRSEWDMAFAGGGEEALGWLAANPCDVVVSDMRMPRMDGCELLHEVLRRHPAMVRIILSGQCDRATSLRCVAPAHQFLTKPCDADALRSTLARTCRFRHALPAPWHRELVSCTTSVPSLRSVYRELLAAANNPQASIRDFSGIFRRDVGLTARAVQFVNSGFFGTPQRVLNVEQAVNLLGVETIRDLVLSTPVFSAMPDEMGCQGMWEVHVDHNLAVAAVAREIVRGESSDQEMAGEAYLAGMLHGVGAIVFAQHDVTRLVGAFTAFHVGHTPLWKLEEEAFGTTRAEIGGYMLDLWGLRERVVEAVALHYAPRRASQNGFGPLTAVHVANGLADRETAGADEIEDWIDTEYLERIGMAHRLEAWQEIHQAMNLAPAGHAPA